MENFIFCVVSVEVTQRTKEKETGVIAGDSIIRNIHSRSLNESLKESLSIVKSFLGAAIQNMVDYTKSFVRRKPDMVILHAGTNDLKSDQTLSDISNSIIKLRGIRSNGTAVVTC